MSSKRQRFIASALSCSLLGGFVPGLALAAEPAPAPAGAAPGATQPKVNAPAPAAVAAPQPAPEGVAAPGAAAGATPQAAPPPTPEVMAEAKQRFDRGFELYEEGDYPLALIEFNRAYELVPNYRVLYNIGQVCIQLGQYANARRALTEYMQKGGEGLGADRKAQVNKDLDMLARRTAFLTVSANIPEAEVLVDDLAVGKTPLTTPLLLDAGVHRITLRHRGYLPRTSHVTLAGGDEQKLDVTLEVQPEEKQTIVVREREVVDNSAQNWMIAGWVTTGALVAGAIVTGILGKGEAGELKDLRGADARDYDDPTLAERISDTEKNASTLFLASDIMSGAALIVGGLSLWITIDPPAEKPPSKPADNPYQLGYSDGQLRFRGSF